MIPGWDQITTKTSAPEFLRGHRRGQASTNQPHSVLQGQLEGMGFGDHQQFHAGHLRFNHLNWRLHDAPL